MIRIIMLIELVAVTPTAYRFESRPPQGVSQREAAKSRIVCGHCRVIQFDD
jgi:hypothetical protein